MATFELMKLLFDYDGYMLLTNVFGAVCIILLLQFPFIGFWTSCYRITRIIKDKYLLCIAYLFPIMTTAVLFIAQLPLYIAVLYDGGETSLDQVDFLFGSHQLTVEGIVVCILSFFMIYGGQRHLKKLPNIKNPFLAFFSGNILPCFCIFVFFMLCIVRLIRGEIYDYFAGSYSAVLFSIFYIVVLIQCLFSVINFFWLALLVKKQGKYYRAPSHLDGLAWLLSWLRRRYLLRAFFTFMYVLISSAIFVPMFFWVFDSGEKGWSTLVLAFLFLPLLFVYLFFAIFPTRLSSFRKFKQQIPEFEAQIPLLKEDLEKEDIVLDGKKKSADLTVTKRFIVRENQKVLIIPLSEIVDCKSVSNHFGLGTEEYCHVFLKSGYEEKIVMNAEEQERLIQIVKEQEDESKEKVDLILEECLCQMPDGHYQFHFPQQTEFDIVFEEAKKQLIQEYGFSIYANAQYVDSEYFCFEKKKTRITLGCDKRIGVYIISHNALADNFLKSFKDFVEQ